MTDRELLEAAYAAYRPGENYTRLVNDAGSDYWNPLTDDGDALRLMVRLRRFPVIERWSDGSFWVFIPGDEQNLEPLDTDPLAATRRAIVKVAAEIGRSMK